MPGACLGPLEPLPWHCPLRAVFDDDSHIATRKVFAVVEAAIPPSGHSVVMSPPARVGPKNCTSPADGISRDDCADYSDVRSVSQKPRPGTAGGPQSRDLTTAQTEAP